MIITAGVDVASQAVNTAACWVGWESQRATVLRLAGGVDDDQLADILHHDQAAKIGLDVPLGWPQAFVDAVSAHQAGREWGDAPTSRLTRRATDRWVIAQALGVPLSVSADRIAYPAMRVARLSGGIDRSGAGRLVEVYPAAALRAWTMEHGRYKGAAGQEVLARMLAALRQRAPWIAAEDSDWTRCAQNDNAFDALICALVARASLVGQCHATPPEHRHAAEVEGWIAVPCAGSLEWLLDGAVPG